MQKREIQDFGKGHRTNRCGIPSFAKPKPKRKVFEPTDEELARLLAQKMPESLRRWILNAMATVGRPTAVQALTPASRDRAYGLINLNPERRRQNKKFGASVREPKITTRRLDTWEGKGKGKGKKKMAADERDCNYASESSIDTALARVCGLKKANLPSLSLFSLRHLGTSVLRRRAAPGQRRTTDNMRPATSPRPRRRCTSGSGES